MSRRREAPMPASAVGLLMFFEEPSSKIKVKPLIIVLLSIVFIIVSGLLAVSPPAI